MARVTSDEEQAWLIQNAPTDIAAAVMADLTRLDNFESGVRRALERVEVASPDSWHAVSEAEYILRGLVDRDKRVHGAELESARVRNLDYRAALDQKEE